MFKTIQFFPNSSRYWTLIRSNLFKCNLSLLSWRPLRDLENPYHNNNLSLFKNKNQLSRPPIRLIIKFRLALQQYFLLYGRSPNHYKLDKNGDVYWKNYGPSISVSTPNLFLVDLDWQPSSLCAKLGVRMIREIGLSIFCTGYSSRIKRFRST